MASMKMFVKWKIAKLLTLTWNRYWYFFKALNHNQPSNNNLHTYISIQNYNWKIPKPPFIVNVERKKKRK